MARTQNEQITAALGEAMFYGYLIEDLVSFMCLSASITTSMYA
jgi:hypothetical protein